jgi:CRISPR/Cas system-associated exonuclease Cas4 (RecB family)
VVRIYQVKKWLNPTAINTYLRCPRKFYYKYVLKLKSKPKKCFLVGKTVHDAPEKFFKHNIYSKAKTYSDLRKGITDLLARKWVSSKEEIESLGLSQKERDETYLEAYKIALTWLDDFLKDPDKDLSPLVEHKLFNHKHQIWCILDIIMHPNTTRAEIRDYKSSKKAKLTDDVKLQLAIQSLCYTDKFGKFPTKLGVHFIRYPRSASNPIYLQPSNELHQWALKKAAIVRAGATTTEIKDYPCTCGGWCKEDFIFEDERCQKDTTTTKADV